MRWFLCWMSWHICRETLARAQAANSAAEEHAASFVTQLQQSQAQRSELQLALAETRAGVQTRNATVAQLTGDLDVERERLRSMKVELDDVLSSRRALQSALDARDAEVTILADELTEARNLEVILRSDLQVLGGDMRRLAEDHNTTVTSLQALIAASEQQVKMMRESLAVAEVTARDQSLLLEQKGVALAEIYSALAREKRQRMKSRRPI